MLFKQTNKKDDFSKTIESENSLVYDFLIRNIWLSEYIGNKANFNSKMSITTNLNVETTFKEKWNLETKRWSDKTQGKPGVRGVTKFFLMLTFTRALKENLAQDRRKNHSSQNG